MFTRLAATIVACSLLLPAPAPAADDRIAALEDAMQLADVFAVMSEEGAAYGEQVETDMFAGSGGDRWRDAVAGIYAPDRMLGMFSGVFGAELADAGGDVAAIESFFTSELGRRVTTLEISARRALLDQGVEDASRLKLAEMRAADEPRIGLIEEFVTVNDLVEVNVSGGLNANYAFYQGLADAGAIGGEMTEGEIIAEVWGQEDAIREETDLWIHSYLIMAYAPLSDAELEEYIAFSQTEPGRDLNRALFAGFDAVFVDVSRNLGRAAGAVLAGHDL